MKKYIFTISFLVLASYGFAQKNINNYKYILVPKQYDFLKSEDQYQLNSLTKFLFNKHGYIAYFKGDELPEDYYTNRCLALTSQVSNEKSGLFKTKLEIILKDCNDQVVMTSQIGESRLKEYKKAFTAALREAFVTYQFLDYKYQQKAEAQSKSVKTEIKKPEEIPSPKTTQKPKVITKTNNEVNEVNTKMVASNPKALETNKRYYAQEIANGFQVVDATPKVVMILLNTSASGVYIVKDKNAIVFKEDGFWYYSENNGGLKEKITLDIKF